MRAPGVTAWSVLIATLPLATVAASAQGAPAASVHPADDSAAVVADIAGFCPALIRANTLPDREALARFGLSGPVQQPNRGLLYRRALPDGWALLEMELADRHCTVHYDEPRYVQVAAAGRAMAERLGFAHFMGEVRGGVRGDVYLHFEGAPPSRSRYIILENPTSGTVLMNYSERPDS